MTTLEALEMVLKEIKKRFSLKTHKHGIGDITGLPKVAKTGRYSDLSGTPAIPSVTIAKYNKPGIVFPGKCLSVNEVGEISINIGEDGGITTEENALKIDKNFFSEKVIEGNSWEEMYREIVDTIDENREKGIYDFKIKLRNNKSNKTITIRLDENRVNNFKNITEFVLKTLKTSEDIPKNDKFAIISGYTDTYDDLVYCELYRLLESENVIDCIELFLYGKTTPQNALYTIGKRLTDVVKVLDDVRRYKELRIYTNNYCNNVEVTYVLTKEDFGEYMPLYEIIRRTANKQD